MKLTAKIKGRQLPFGKVRVSGAKNAATRLLAAALISDETVILDNFPTELVDANHKIRFIINSKGLVDINNEKESLTINSTNLVNQLLSDYDYPIRTTYLLVAGLIKKSGMAQIPYPG